MYTKSVNIYMTLTSLLLTGSIWLITIIFIIQNNNKIMVFAFIDV